METENTSPHIKRFILFAAVLLTAVFTALNYHVNDHDTMFFSNVMWDFVRGNYDYQSNEGLSLFPDEDFVVGGMNYMNPPQSAYLILPFLAFTPRWSAFWNLFFIMLVLVGNAEQLNRALARLTLIFTAPLIVVAAAANFVGIATGLGLFILLIAGRGWLRGIAWAFMLTRPQDTFMILAYELVTSLRQRDWRAYVTCAALLLIPVIQYDPFIYVRWLSTPVVSAKNLGLTVDSPVLAVSFVLVIFAIRFVNWQDGRFTWRRWGSLPKVEQFWLLTVTGHILGPYTSYYMIWMFLLPVRNYAIWRTVVLFVGVTVIGLLFFTAADRIVFQRGMVILVTFVAVLTPRISVEQTVEEPEPSRVPKLANQQ